MSGIKEIYAEDLYRIGPGGVVHDNGGFTAEAGLNYPSVDGSRFFYGTANNEAIFIQSDTNGGDPTRRGRIFYQKPSDFVSDINRGAIGADLTKRLAPTKAVLKNAMDIYLGVLTVSGGPVAWTVTGMNLLVAGGQLKQNYSKYCAAMEALVDAQTGIRPKMPIFYEHVIGELVIGRIEQELRGKGRALITGAIPGPKVAGKLVGVFLGKVGENKLKQRLNAIKKLIQEVLLKVADHVNSKNEGLSETQVEQLCTHHVIPILRDAGAVTPPMSRAKEIIRETERHAREMRPQLNKIAVAIGVL